MVCLVYVWLAPAHARRDQESVSQVWVCVHVDVHVQFKTHKLLCKAPKFLRGALPRPPLGLLPPDPRILGPAHPETERAAPRRSARGRSADPFAIGRGVGKASEKEWKGSPWHERAGARLARTSGPPNTSERARSQTKNVVEPRGAPLLQLALITGRRQKAGLP